MDNKRLFDLIVLGLWLLTASVFYVQNGIRTQDRMPIPEKSSFVLQPNKELEIKKISVIKGDLFELTLKDQSSSRIFAKLPINAIDDSKRKVVKILREVVSPRVFLVEKKQDGRWIVNIFFLLENQESNLVDWLEQNNLVSE